MNRFLLPACLAALLLSACFGRQAPAPVSRYGVTPGVGSAGVHNVRAGDTIWTISQRYNIGARDIAQANNLSAPFALSAGQRLILPPPREYKARDGDTLYSISRLFAVGSSELAALNALAPPYAVAPGQVLRLPSLARSEDQNPPPAAPAVPAFMPPTVSPPQSSPVLAYVPPLAYDTPPVPAPVIVPETIAPPPPPPPAQGTVAAAGARIAAETPKRSSSRFLVPVKGPVISDYGPKSGGLHNDGMNIQAPEGTPVLAAENGVVVYAGSDLKGSGNLVLLRHEGRWMTAYAHMSSIKVARGAVVRRGETIGAVGTTGSVNSPQLHFEVRRGTEALNPAMYVEG